MTPELVEKCRQLQSKVEQLSNERAHRDRIDRLTKASGRLSRNQGELASQLEVIAAMRGDAQDITVDHVKGRIGAIKDSLSEISADPLASVERHDTDALAEKFTALSQELRAAIERCWAQLAANSHLADVVGLLSALMMVDSYKERAESLLTRVVALQNVLNKAAASDAATYRNFRAELVKVLDDIARLRISDKPGLEAFLKDAASGDADLTRLTPPILRWINEQGLASHFFIRPGNPHD